MITLRKANLSDLAAINKVIDAAIMSWDLPERVKRLALPGYHYDAHDLDTLELMVSENGQQQITGVAGWEKADQRESTPGENNLLLHGIYVSPEHQRQGTGTKLFLATEQAAFEQGFDGLLVKAQSSAADFFLAKGMRPLAMDNENRDYPHRYWKLIKKGESNI